MNGGFIVTKKMTFSLKSPFQSLDGDDAGEDGFAENADDNPNSVVTFSFTNDSSKVTNISLLLNSNLPFSSSLHHYSSIPKVPVAEPKPPAIAITKSPLNSKRISHFELVDIRTLQLQAKGITPPVDGEYFEIKRTFMLRQSTVSEQQKLKIIFPIFESSQLPYRDWQLS